MRISSSSLVGDFTDAPQPLQSFDATNASGANMVFWCKGVKISGSVEATGNDVDKWEVGLIQILGTHTMVAKFKDGNKPRTITWKQRQMPCYDSGATDHIPWYNKNMGPDGKTSCEDLVVDTETFVALQDYPTMKTFLSLDDNQPFKGGRNPKAQLYYVKKTLRFEVYLAVRKKNTAAWRTSSNMTILKSLWWSTQIEAERQLPSTKNAALHFGFKAKSHIRRNGEVSDVTRALNTLLPAGKLSANGSIGSIVS